MDTATPASADTTHTRTCDLAPTTGPPTAPALLASNDSDGDTTREHDRDLDPATFDPQTGEFRPPARRPASLKAAAVAWVTAALAATTGQDASNDPAATPKRKARP